VSSVKEYTCFCLSVFLVLSRCISYAIKCNGQYPSLQIRESNYRTYAHPHMCTHFLSRYSSLLGVSTDTSSSASYLRNWKYKNIHSKHNYTLECFCSLNCTVNSMGMNYLKPLTCVQKVPCFSVSWVTLSSLRCFHDFPQSLHENLHLLF
jgi:hypothetical protein